MKNYSQGSLWRRWDLHVHTKGTNKNDNFTSPDFNSFCITFFRKALDNKIAVIGVTDYFTIDNYLEVCQFVKEIHTSSSFSEEEKEQIQGISLIPNVELRIFPTTQKGRMINIHCLFNPEFVPRIDNCFFNKLKHKDGNGNEYLMNRSGFIDLGKSLDSSSDDIAAYKLGIRHFSLSHNDLIDLKNSDKEFRENVIIAVSNKSTDGASGLQEHYDLFEGKEGSSLDAVRSAIYRLSDCMFSSNQKDVDYFSGKRCDDEETVKKKCGSIKPCIHGSDAHDEEKLFTPDNNKYCWIKADPTFDGLRQIIFEPNSGDRVFIGEVKPDQKDSFKVIKKITFEDSDDFPLQIKFNPNLCSIIGSRSSGKSALLAYIADSIDSNQTRSKKDAGPGEGFPWDNVTFRYSVEWANNKLNDENLGKVVYIPQNFLYGMSAMPQIITEKIIPVLRAKLPQIDRKYLNIERDVNDINNGLDDLIDNWFNEQSQKTITNSNLKDLGALESVEAEKTSKEQEIKEIQSEKKLDEEDIARIQELSKQNALFEGRKSIINSHLVLLGEEGKEGKYFKQSEVSLIPSISDLPDTVKTKIDNYLKEAEQKIVTESNSIIKKFTENLESELQSLEVTMQENSQELKGLQDKQEKNENLDSLIKQVSELTSTIDEIAKISKNLTLIEGRLAALEKEIESLLEQRKNKIDELETLVNQTDQTGLSLGMTFAVEANIDSNDLESLVQKLNVQSRSEFINTGKPDIEKIRNQSANFLEAVFLDTQKIKKGYDKKAVCVESLTLTEKILFTAEMEGDKIGGFKASTMTPGKRALFALRLLLAESEDTWPLLIDQPEDDLDSRSIYNDIVPFLREKKKERQIIMVSHNANLVVGADSEQVIVANRNGDDRPNEDRKQFNYLSGGLENKKVLDPECLDTLRSQGIREHTCQILEGGELAFEKRSNRYDLSHK